MCSLRLGCLSLVDQLLRHVAEQIAKDLRAGRRGRVDEAAAIRLT